ncbi:UNVERIFIED_CONTAM: hypothetical protein Sradi_1511100 [Sesamum radiatum]|uniref:Uncharacterized protein n=1 Tax=Sesamum radiatum TaxID=300843 RepID=A0AAW2U7C8_SESRA
MVFDTAKPIFWSSNYNQDDAPDNGTMSFPTDAGPSSYYGGAPYDYVSGLKDRFYDVVHVAKQLVWNDCTQSQLASVVELVNIKAEGHISQHIYDLISQWDDIDLDYYKFYGESRYKTIRERNPNRKKNSKACHFDCHRQFLPLDHPYRRNKKSFTKNWVESNIARPRLTGEQIRDWVKEFNPAVEVPLSLPDGYGSKHKWTKESILWELKYWSTHLIRHNLDVMHIEKNVFNNIFNIMIDIKGKTKDNLDA